MNSTSPSTDDPRPTEIAISDFQLLIREMYLEKRFGQRGFRDFYVVNGGGGRIVVSPTFR